MALPRRVRQEKVNRVRLVYAFLSLLACVTPALAQKKVGEAALEMSVDPRSGYAIDGFDPISFFTKDGPKQGVRGIEAFYAGVNWKFLNEGNKKAFLISPQFYSPRFGGHDPMALIRGYVTSGSPDIYVMHKDRLYFFFSHEARAEFVTNIEKYVAQAQRALNKIKID